MFVQLKRMLSEGPRVLKLHHINVVRYDISALMFEGRYLQNVLRHSGDMIQTSLFFTQTSHFTWNGNCLWYQT